MELKLYKVAGVLNGETVNISVPMFVNRRKVEAGEVLQAYDKDVGTAYRGEAPSPGNAASPRKKGRTPD